MRKYTKNTINKSTWNSKKPFNLPRGNQKRGIRNRKNGSKNRKKRKIMLNVSHLIYQLKDIDWHSELKNMTLFYGTYMKLTSNVTE